MSGIIHNVKYCEVVSEIGYMELDEKICRNEIV